MKVPLKSVDSIYSLLCYFDGLKSDMTVTV